MSEVISVRVSRRLKEELEALGINYAKLVREYLEGVVMREKMRLLLQEADRIRGEIAREQGTLRPSWELVREDRDEGDR